MLIQVPAQWIGFFWLRLLLLAHRDAGKRIVWAGRNPRLKCPAADSGIRLPEYLGWTVRGYRGIVYQKNCHANVRFPELFPAKMDKETSVILRVFFNAVVESFYLSLIKEADYSLFQLS